MHSRAILAGAVFPRRRRPRTLPRRTLRSRTCDRRLGLPLSAGEQSGGFLEIALRGHRCHYRGSAEAEWSEIEQLGGAADKASALNFRSFGRTFGAWAPPQCGELFHLCRKSDIDLDGPHLKVGQNRIRVADPSGVD